MSQTEQESLHRGICCDAPVHCGDAAALGVDRGTGVVTLRRMGLGDLPYVVSEHRKHFPDGFFVRLGPKFLTRYYRTFLDGPPASAIVAEVDGAVCGYLVGALSPQRHRRLLLQYHGRALALAGVWGLLTHPSLVLLFAVTRLRRYAVSLLRARRDTIERPGSVGGQVAFLSHLAVSSQAQGAGVGSALIQHFVQAARSAGCTRVLLVTLASADGAGEFYERRGWLRTGERRTSEGRSIVVYERPLDVADKAHPE